MPTNHLDLQIHHKHNTDMKNPLTTAAASANFSSSFKPVGGTDGDRVTTGNVGAVICPDTNIGFVDDVTR
jgi:hypothetical protein